MKLKTFHLSNNRKDDVTKSISFVLQARPEIAFAYVFGSFTDDLPIHDVDVGVYLSDARKSPALLYALDLSDNLSRQVHIPVEVTVLNGAPSSFLYHVIKGRLLFIRDEEVYTQVVEDTVRRYLDIRPILRRSTKEAFAS
ncbi:MAG: hypothetical protein A2X56_03135 [Nitrospirae bacterium GWC2_57_13]|jgi:uncharacterized protein|nr:MAG: hypothetical protein A2X56_03135 [Nitrospirae bacterium GWC2_57_13]OGW45757.1 MAG: hypothetical protein A2X57_04810 [Nitrospirae bacterium GWD2_57_8]HAR46353.1 nucleotidyltransferase domain-containing protein [Nitrospiraceae bacterium]HAS53286.1 nucleotidyltransferase domain-containing protein [Nitrospiraceae bacterium]